MKKINLGQKEVIHFIGIGGIGMSGLAQIMKNLGFKIQGSDQIKNKNTVSCSKSGIKVFIGHSKKILKIQQLLSDPRLLKIVIMKLFMPKKDTNLFKSRSASRCGFFKKNIIITGSHGKTTTTSLVSKILTDQKLDPTIINGGVINSFKSNAKLGNGDWAILEADESDGSFLKLPINYSIVTNIDYEHVDFYKNYKNLEDSFIQFIEKTPPTGKAIVCIDNTNLKRILHKIKNKNILTYGESKNATYKISNIRYYCNYTCFDLNFKNIEKKNINIKNIYLNLLGKHNVLNATAAIVVCLSLGIKENILKKSLKKFSGVQRRMTKIFSKNKNDFYDDYAHHPTEIISILNGVRNAFKNRKIVSIFEPHRYSRVLSLKTEFAKSFLQSNLVILCPLYAAGEKKNIKYNQLKFGRMISKFSKTQVILLKNYDELGNYLRKTLTRDEIIIGMGAGSISKHMRNLKNYL